MKKPILALTLVELTSCFTPQETQSKLRVQACEEKATEMLTFPGHQLNRDLITAQCSKNAKRIGTYDYENAVDSAREYLTDEGFKNWELAEGYCSLDLCKEIEKERKLSDPRLIAMVCAKTDNYIDSKYISVEKFFKLDLAKARKDYLDFEAWYKQFSPDFFIEKK